MRCNCENSECRACHGRGCHSEAGERKALYIGALCDPCADEMPTRYLRTDMPTVFWNTDNECWCIQSGDIFVSFYEPGELIVSGHDITAQVTYDQITEDRGLRFQDGQRRVADFKERLGFKEDK